MWIDISDREPTLSGTYKVIMSTEDAPIETVSFFDRMTRRWSTTNDWSFVDKWWEDKL